MSRCPSGVLCEGAA
jgi:hypothetical protein